MNDFVGEKDSAIREFSASLVGEVQSEIDSVAEAELFSESKGEPAGFEPALLVLDAFYEITVVVGDQ
jgi:hypothetical protein